MTMEYCSVCKTYENGDYIFDDFVCNNCKDHVMFINGKLYGEVGRENIND